MIIIEIALGIILAVLILNFLAEFLEELLALGALLVGVAVILAIGGLLIYWLVNNPRDFALLAVIGVGTLLAVIIGIYLIGVARTANLGIWPALIAEMLRGKGARIRELQAAISHRRSLGYDTENLEKDLSVEIQKSDPTAAHGDLKSQRELGYTDDNNIR